MVSLIGNLVSFGISLLASFIFIPAGGLPLPRAITFGCKVLSPVF